ncbi:MAG: polyprenyl synthetase family protein [Halobacteriales archaeon]
MEEAMEDVLGGYAREVESALEDVGREIEPRLLSEAVLHVSMSGGKRLRPALTLLSYEAVGASGPRERALRYAVGVEYVHTSALVADDVIDRSDVRRGAPSVHDEFDHDVAVLSSNALLAKALEITDDRRAVEAMVSAVRRLGEGEAMELVENLGSTEEYEELAYRKTAALFEAACVVGGVAGEASDAELDALADYARHLGIAFQIRDDVLDYTSTQDDLGKPVGRDALLDRPSVVAVHLRSEDARLPESVEYARGLARDHVEEARDAAEALEPSGARESLSDVAGFAVDRRV